MTDSANNVKGTKDPWSAPVKALVLDLDDTLLDTRGAMHRAAVSAGRELWPDTSSGSLEAFAGVYYDDPGGCFDAYTRGEMTFDEQRGSRVATAAGRVGLDLARYDVFAAAYTRTFAAAQVVFDDVQRLLQVAAARHVGVCLLTNGSDAITAEKLAAVGLTGCAPVVTTDTFGVGKPDPRVYLRACELAGATPSTTVSVGDTLPTDVVGARRAGLRAAWLQRPGVPPPRAAGWGTPIDDPSVRIVSSLDEVAALLA